MPRLVGTDESGEAVDYLVKSQPVTIGRSAECIVHIADTAVSRLHAVVERTNGKLVIKDHSSKGGILVNDDKVDAEHELDEGDTVTIGPATFEVKLSDGGPDRDGRKVIGSDGKEVARPSRREKREVLGGMRLSKKGQTIVKIVSAAISFMCIVGIVWLLAGYRRAAPVVVKKETRIDQMARPRALADEARDIAKRARDEEHKSNTDEALKLFEEAKAKIEEATALVEELSQKYSGAGYSWVEKEAASLNTQAQGIRQEVFRLQMQKMRNDAGH
jgi:pSer/pThr/pTyr-binding forkhead associated (FHA) protein